MRAVSKATQLLLRSIAKVAGSEIIDDTIAFFQAFDGMETGFRDRAHAVEELLNASGTSYVLVTTPRSSAIAETAWLADQLREEDHAVASLVVNRILPLDLSNIAPSFDAEPKEGDWGVLLGNALELAALGRAEIELIAAARVATRAANVVKVPNLGQDIHDVSSLLVLTRHLLQRAVL